MIAVTWVYLLLLLSPLHFHVAASSTESSTADGFYILNVKETTSGTANRSLPARGRQQSSKSANGGEVDGERGHWRLELVHRDAIAWNLSSGSYRRRFEDRIERDADRVRGLTRRLTASGPAAGRRATDFGSGVVSGMNVGSGEFFVRIGVGSPPRSQYMVIDSGSDIVWVQCKPCSQCYRQADPVFDPAASATFSGVPCDSDVCSRLDQSAKCRSGRCHYEVLYGDGSYTMGTLALETLTFGDQTEVRNVAIGCGHRNRGLFIGAAGLLGLGGGPLSFVGQLGGQAGGAFGYCLSSRGPASSSGYLTFGRGAVPVGAVWVPLLRNPRSPSFYYVGLSGLAVGGATVPVPEDIFRLTELGDGGAVMDTGTAVTRFPDAAYRALRDAFAAVSGGLPRAPGVSIFDTCYDLSGFEFVRIPTVSFFFSGGPVLTLPANNVLVPVDEAGTYCLAFAASSTGLSILGNLQQEGIHISIDAADGFVGFGPNTC